MRPHSNNTVNCQFIVCKKLQGTKITLYTILLGVGGTICTAHTLDQFRKQDIDLQRSTERKEKKCACQVRLCAYWQGPLTSKLASEVYQTCTEVPCPLCHIVPQCALCAQPYLNRTCHWKQKHFEYGDSP
eukprot:1156356-Pelagomonas_calceolata.AAC.3